MKNIIKLIFSVFICASGLGSNCQSLGVNDQVPDLSLQHLIFYPSKVARLKDFNSKYLILDFWATNCGSCIAAFPKLENIEKRYADKLQILMVTPESEERIETFFKNRKRATGLSHSIPICCNDSILSKIFQHQYVPHYVWIDPEGRVCLVHNGSDEITEQNIEKFIKGGQFQSGPKKEPQDEYGFNKSVIQNPEFHESDLVFYSILTKYQPDSFSATIGSCDNKEGYRISALNRDICSMYQLAYDNGDDEGGRGLFGLPRSRVIFETDTTHFVREVNGLEKTENLYCYELKVPSANNYGELKELMKSDLIKYFHLNAHFEKRLTQCWVLQSDDTMAVKSKGGKPLKKTDQYTFELQNTSLSLLFKLLRLSYMPLVRYPLIDETGILGPVDIHFTADMTSPESINQALAPFKMHFRLQQRWVDMLIIRKMDEYSIFIDNIRDNKIALYGH